MSLRPYQLEAADTLDDGDLLVLATGLGKTRTLSEVVRREADRGGLTLWVAHRNELLGQASQALRNWWLTPEVNVLVRSIQELRGKPPIPDVTMLVWDEAHHAVSDDWSRLRTEQYPRAKLVGATATPQRGDGKGLGLHFKRIVNPIGVREAIEAGYLVRPTVLRPDRALGPGELAQRPEQAWVDHAQRPDRRQMKTIVFYPTVDLAVQGACAFREAGAVTAAVWGDMPAEQRRKTLELFARGEIQVLANCNLLTEGFDVPDTECVILARGFGSASGYLQAVGRAMRVAPGKSGALVLDLRGCSHEHGEPDDERTYHLEGKGIRRAGDGAECRFCPVCGSVVAGTGCELCGHSGEMRRRPPRVLGLALDRFARVRKDDSEAQALRLSRWLRECRSKGWNEGRALHRFKGAYGDWPARDVVTRARVLAT